MSVNQTVNDGEACATCGPWWRLPLVLAVVFAAIVAFRGGVRDENSPDPAPSAAAMENQTGQAVSIAIDFGNGTISEFMDLAWSEGMTVADALEAVGKGASGVTFAQRGTGEMAFLTEVGGMRNEGAGGRNWTYTVNGTRADRSFAVYELQPGDRVLWTFAAPK